jgi:aryl-alcohol dehydrogenase-like predicted oxidoreductase
MTLEQRPLGATGLRVSRIGFGGAAIGIAGYLTDEDRDAPDAMKAARQAIAAAVDAGITLFDTAPGYGFGRAERLFGDVLPPHRERIVLATKVKVSPGEGFADWNRSLDASLARLRTNRVDLLQLHGMSWTDELAAWAIEGGALDWLAEARRDGRARCIGVTAEVPSGGLERLLRTRRFDVLQMAYGVIYQGACDYQRAPFGPIPLAKSLGMGVLAMRSATSGVLHKLLRQEFSELDAARITRLALRFVLSTPEVDCALIGMRTAEEVAANAALAADAAARFDLRALHDFFDGRAREAPP